MRIPLPARPRALAALLSLSLAAPLAAQAYPVSYEATLDSVDVQLDAQVYSDVRVTFQGLAETDQLVHVPSSDAQFIPLISLTISLDGAPAFAILTELYFATLQEELILLHPVRSASVWLSPFAEGTDDSDYDLASGFAAALDPVIIHDPALDSYGTLSTEQGELALLQGETQGAFAAAPSPVPLPAAGLLLVGGLGALGLSARRHAGRAAR